MAKVWRVGLAWRMIGYGEDASNGIADYSRRFGPFQFVGGRIAGLSDIDLQHLRGNDTVDGMLAFDWVETGTLAKIDWPAGIPIVSGEPNPSKFMDYQVSPDNRVAGQLVAEEFLGRGLRSFAYCPFALPRPRLALGSEQWDQERLAGFAEVVVAAGHPLLIYAHARAGRISYEREWMGPLANWLRSLPRPVGIMAANDSRARHLLLAAEAAHLRVPEEIAVIGVDNLIWTKLTLPTISSVDLDGYGAGYAAMEMLHHLMQGQTVEPMTVRIRPRRLIRRRSSDLLAIDDADVLAAMHFIAKHATDGIGVEQVVEASAVSRRALERRFERWLNRSILDEIRAVQIERAKALLADKSIPLRRVAQAAGFTSPKALSTMFHRITSKTPSAFRAAAVAAQTQSSGA